MRYPIGEGTQADFDKNWYIASFFGEERLGYYHSGDDYNLKTGGDTDLGEPLYACADGEITSTDTTSMNGFGKQIYLKIIIDGKIYYVGYDHCDSIVVKAGDKVKEGDILGYLGKSGTKWAHLHFVIKNKANGMDNVPNTKEELTEWENPTEFIKKNMSESSEEEEMLLEYLGMPNEVEAMKRLEEHLGGSINCEWGDEKNERGGHLGNARRKVKALEAHECPIIPETDPSDELKLIKRVEETDVDGTKTTKTFG